MASRNVHLFQIGSDFLAFPSVIVLKGGNERIKFINTTDEKLQAKFAPGVLESDDPVKVGKKAAKETAKAKSQGNGNFNVSTYEITPQVGLDKKKKKKKKKKKTTLLFSDPVIIIEN